MKHCRWESKLQKGFLISNVHAVFWNSMNICIFWNSMNMTIFVSQLLSPVDNLYEVYYEVKLSIFFSMVHYIHCAIGSWHYWSRDEINHIRWNIAIVCHCWDNNGQSDLQCSWNFNFRVTVILVQDKNDSPWKRISILKIM